MNHQQKVAAIREKQQKETRRTLAAEIAARVSATAYMNYAYSEGAYRRVALFLLEAGLSPLEAEWVMDSKHMRWASDSEDGRNVTSETFKRYWAGNSHFIRQDLKRYAGDVAWYGTRQAIERGD